MLSAKVIEKIEQRHSVIFFVLFFFRSKVPMSGLREIGKKLISKVLAKFRLSSWVFCLSVLYTLRTEAFYFVGFSLRAGCGLNYCDLKLRFFGNQSTVKVSMGYSWRKMLSKAFEKPKQKMKTGKKIC